MKIKDMNLPGFFLKQSTRWSAGIVIYIVGVMEIAVRSTWSQEVTGHRKALDYRRVSLSPDGKAVEVRDRDRYSSDIQPGRVASQITEEAAITMLAASRANRERADYTSKMCLRHNDAMAAAMADSGFPKGRSGYTGVVFDKFAVTEWAESQGLGLPEREEG